MRKSYSFFAALMMALILTTAANAQSITISGNIRNDNSKDAVPAASVVVKGTSTGTFTDPNGNFSLKVAKLPVVLVISSVGFDNQELTVSSATQEIKVDLKVNNSLGQEVVVSATRTPQRILESPVTVERLSGSSLRSIAAPSVYEGIGNLKGVDVHTASLSFRTITTRGFVSSGNTRLNQLIDGMDNQAPGLNFSVGSVTGLTDLDVDNIEVLAGASSALYGSGGMNGTVLINSKNPFKYQGLSYNIKQGIMHVDGKQRNAAPYYNWSFRWAKAINNKWAIKLAAEMIKGSDWQADDYRNKRIDATGLYAVAGGNRNNTPDFNGINTYGDETSVNIAALSQVLQSTINNGVLQLSAGTVNLNNSLGGYLGLIGNPTYPTTAQINTYLANFAANPTLQQAAALHVPFYLGNTRNYFGQNPSDRANNNVTRTGYEEKYLVDYGNLNVKFTGGLHYKITENIEASLNTYVGVGTTVYTGADRYSLRNLKLAQHKLEVKAKNWMVRAYTTQENAGESYNASAAGAFVNEAWKPTAPVAAQGLPGIASSWIGNYILTYSEGRRQNGAAVSDANLHAAARASSDIGRLVPGTPQYDAALKKVRTTPIKNGGALFLDKTDLWAGEAQVNISDAAHFSDKIEVIGGVQWKQYVLNSQGTLFADNTDSLIGYAKIPNRGNIKVNETGGYVQLRKKLLNDVLTLSGSVRYDKQTNFEGKFTPRFTATIKVAKDNNLRFSYQNAYRFPTMQNQYIALSTGTAVLIGCLPEFQTIYKLNGALPGYTAASIVKARTTGLTSDLVLATFKDVKPESVNSYEAGYKGILGKKLLVDAYVYYSQYKDFLATIVVGQSKSGAQAELLSPFSTTNISYTQNSPENVKAIGWGIGLDYNIIKTYYIYGNVFSDQLKDAPANLVTFFNAPKYRFNIGLRNENVCHNFGFSTVVKWQDNNFYEGTFVKGTLPYFASVDAQVTYKPAKTKSTFRVGGTNLGNNYYRTGYGSPAVGGLYYISYGYNL